MYINQIDEQKILKEKTKLYCFKTRQKAINEAIKDSIEIAIFDDGLQDKSINYNLKFVKTYNLNVGSKEKDRLIRQFYLISKK